MSLSRRQVTSAAVASIPLAFAATGTAHAGGRRHRTLYIAGDSTAAQKYAELGCRILIVSLDSTLLLQGLRELEAVAAAATART